MKSKIKTILITVSGLWVITDAVCRYLIMDIGQRKIVNVIFRNE